MNSRALLCALILFAVALATPSCGGVINNPSPHITTLTPPGANAGDTGFTLFVNGSGFAPQSAIIFNGRARATMFLADNQVTTKIFPSDLATAGTVTVQVSTPSPGGGNSNIVNFTINPVVSPVPQVSSISPSGGPFAGEAGLTLQVTGSNFVPQSIVTVNNNNRQTAFVNATTLQAGVLSTDIASACGPPTTTQCPQIGVLNPSPGGGASNTVTLTITNPPPMPATLSPTVTQAGGSNITLTVNGSGFDMASVINFNGVPFDGTNASPKTTFVSNTQLTVSLAAAELAAAETVPVTVKNPLPGGGTAISLPFSITPTSTGVGLPELVDVANDGTQASNGIGDPTILGGPTIDSTGEFVAFASISESLVSNDSNGFADIFLRDTCLGVTMNCTPKTTLVSLTSTGAQANGPSSEPSMDSSAQFVAFTSTATNLVSTAAFTGNQQVYLRGVCHAARGGCVVSTSLISVATDGMSPANSDAFQPAISPDGRFVAFTSAASNLVTGVTPAAGVTQIYLYDTCHGVPASSACKPSMTLVSSPDATTVATTPADGASSQPAVGTGGQFVSFTSTATNLGPANPSGAQEIFVRNTCLGAASGCTPVTTLVSSPDVTPPPTTLANGPSAQSAISSNGRFITFASTATNLCPVAASCNGTQQIFLRDTCAGVSSGCTPAASLVSIANDGMTAGNALSERPVVDSTGQFVAFASLANNLATTATSGFEQVFVRNTCTGASGTCTATTALASVTAASGTPPATTPGNNNSVSPALSGNGHFVSFISLATNLVTNDTNNANDVFLAVTTF